MQPVWLWLVGGTLLAAPAWWFAWRAHLRSELTNFQKTTTELASHYASAHYGPGGMAQVARHFRFDRLPPRVPLHLVQRRRLHRDFERGRTRRERKEQPVQHYLAVVFFVQHTGEIAVRLEPAVGLSAWHAFETMAKERDWPLGDVEHPPAHEEPDPDGKAVPYFVPANNAALVYMFLDLSWFARVRRRVGAIGRHVRRRATRAWAVARAARRRLRRRLRRAQRQGKR